MVEVLTGEEFAEKLLKEAADGFNWFSFLSGVIEGGLTMENLEPSVMEGMLVTKLGVSPEDAAKLVKNHIDILKENPTMHRLERRDLAWGLWNKKGQH